VVVPLDVSSQASIAAFAERVGRLVARIDVLVNNAGAWYADRRTSVDGIELTWATNVLGPHLLSGLLLPALRRAASANGEARVVHVGSHLASGLDLGDVEYVRRPFEGFKGAYPQSKQALHMLTLALAERTRGSGVAVNVVGPGWVRSDVHRSAPFATRIVMNTVGSLFARTVQAGADTPTWAAASTELAGASGKYFEDRKERPLDYSPSDVTAVWRLCEAMTTSTRGMPFAAASQLLEPTSS
jgi:NAD(P)-dependent dehydrogenase (short-subunit alcohol dehydrogenase family)